MDNVKRLINFQIFVATLWSYWINKKWTWGK